MSHKRSEIPASYQQEEELRQLAAGMQGATGLPSPLPPGDQEVPGASMSTRDRLASIARWLGNALPMRGGMGTPPPLGWYSQLPGRRHVPDYRPAVPAVPELPPMSDSLRQLSRPRVGGMSLGERQPIPPPSATASSKAVRIDPATGVRGETLTVSGETRKASVPLTAKEKSAINDIGEMRAPAEPMPPTVGPANRPLHPGVEQSTIDPRLTVDDVRIAKEYGIPPQDMWAWWGQGGPSRASAPAVPDYY